MELGECQIELWDNELVSNSLKHAFPGNSEVRIHEHEDGCQLHVADDGVGIHEGVDLNSQDSLGFRLVKALTKNLKGIRMVF